MTGPAPVVTPLSAMVATAQAMAKNWGLVREDGSIKCKMGGCDNDALVPSLHCPHHLARWREMNPQRWRRGLACQNFTQAEWEARDK